MMIGVEGWDVSQTWVLTSCKRWGEVLGCGRSYIGRKNCTGWPGLMDGITNSGFECMEYFSS
jgi:hypothetical protein